MSCDKTFSPVKHTQGTHVNDVKLPEAGYLRRNGCIRAHVPHGCHFLSRFRRNASDTSSTKRLRMTRGSISHAVCPRSWGNNHVLREACIKCVIVCMCGYVS
jgi:hypothetical protein